VENGTGHAHRSLATHPKIYRNMDIVSLDKHLKWAGKQMHSDQDGMDVKTLRRKCSKLQTRTVISHSPGITDKFQVWQRALAINSSPVLHQHFWKWLRSAFLFEYFWRKFEIKNFEERGLNSVSPGVLIVFSNENAECYMMDQWEGKYSYWDVRSFDLWKRDADDPARPRESYVLTSGPLTRKVHKNEFIPHARPRFGLNSFILQINPKFRWFSLTFSSAE
jgi:hypothetical protein